MRFFEIIILVTAVIMLVGSLLPATKKSEIIIGFLFLVLIQFVLHFLLEKPRWQMIPAYALLCVLACIFVAQYFFRPDNHAEKTNFLTELLIGFVLLLGWSTFVIAVILPVVLPVFKFPDPSGPYQIGTRDFYFIDESRVEDLSPDPNVRRELMVRVWYPAQPGLKEQVQPYWEHADRIGPPIMNRFGFPPFALNHLALVKTHSYLNAPLVDQSETFPVLVFSHGYGQSDFSMNLTQMEELASHGYILFSINHTYESWATVFPDGRVISENEDVFNFLNNMGGKQINLNTRLAVWVADTQFVLDQLERLNTDAGDPFAGKLNLDHLGVFGMSFGGATAAEVCLIDSRCKAGANMDGGQFGQVDFSVTRLQVPFMFFYSEPNEGMNDYIYERVENRAYRVVVEGASHINYTDTVLWSPFSKYASRWVRYPIGTIDQHQMISITNTYLLAFFDRHLMGEEPLLLDEPISQFPEVDYRFR